jgi:hypothetical protein
LILHSVEEFAHPFPKRGDVDGGVAGKVFERDVFRIDFRQFFRDDLNIPLEPLRHSVATDEIAVVELAEHLFGRVPKASGDAPGAVGQNELQVKNAVFVRTQRLLGDAVRFGNDVVFFDLINKKTTHNSPHCFRNDNLTRSPPTDRF